MDNILEEAKNGAEKGSTLAGMAGAAYHLASNGTDKLHNRVTQAAENAALSQALGGTVGGTLGATVGAVKGLRKRIEQLHNKMHELP